MRLVEPTVALTSDAALAAVSAAVKAAEGHGVRINAAVVDAGGNLMAFLRCPGAFLHSINIAIDKAYTAASFGFASGDWAKVLEGEDEVRQGLRQVPRLVMIGGGLPIVVDGRTVGGIGVSGASERQDMDCARAGLTALGLD